MQAVVEHADVPSGDGDGHAAGDDRRHLVAMPGDRRPLVGWVLRVEALIRRCDGRRMRLVERPDRIDRRVELRARPALRLGEASPDHLHAGERVAQAHQVDVAKLVELGAQQPLSVGVRHVALEHVEAATVEIEVARAASQPPVDIGVVALALLPPGGDQGNRALDAERLDLRGQVDPIQGPEQGHLPHEACTRTVSPTTLSM